MQKIKNLVKKSTQEVKLVLRTRFISPRTRSKKNPEMMTSGAACSEGAPGVRRIGGATEVTTLCGGARTPAYSQLGRRVVQGLPEQARGQFSYLLDSLCRVAQRAEECYGVDTRGRDRDIARGAVRPA